MRNVFAFLLLVLPPAVPAADYPANVYFGDLHIHTRYSFDAYLLGTLVTPDESYRFAKGETIESSFGIEMALEEPLDFYAVTDHAMFLGVVPQWADPTTDVGKLEGARPYHGINEGDNLTPWSAQKRGVLFRETFGSLARTPGTPAQQAAAKAQDHPAAAFAAFDDAAHRAAWQDIIGAAERHNEPSKFTTFVAYEWTASTPAPESAAYHRNVIFGSSQAPERPFSRFDSSNPEDLWAWMDAQRAAGIDSLAIPHNSNGSNGQTFKQRYSDGRPIDQAHSTMRARNEPLVEITQKKGTSETHPRLSTRDEWADFEILNTRKGKVSQFSRPSGSYVREALINGLALDQEGRGNPFKFGFVGATDSHTGTTSVVESAFFDNTPENRGSIPVSQERLDYMANLPASERARGRLSQEKEGPYFGMRGTQFGASGLAAIWAPENTREALFAALKRKETYGTSGPRIKLRFFGGFGLSTLTLNDPNLAELAYETGVPMGGDLLAESPDTAPEFLVWAERDPNGAPLQRIQIIKGWYDGGYLKQPNEIVYDVACADGGSPDQQTHRCPDNGASVDLADCSIPADKGDSEIRAVWRDPDFQPGQHAVYYARVLQNPTCRWSTWDAVRAGVEPRDGIAETIQERAWSSPIWYSGGS
jgi:hypothetical protein